MRVLLDTSVIVPALCPAHQHHSVCLPWLESAFSGRMVMIATSHCLAATYAVLTRLPFKPKLGEINAWQMIRENIVERSELIDVPAFAYCEIIDELAKAGLGGGVVYDGLIAKAAELSGVDFLVTRNAAHFISVWPRGANRIVSPLNQSAP